MENPLFIRYNGLANNVFLRSDWSDGTCDATNSTPTKASMERLATCTASLAGKPFVKNSV